MELFGFTCESCGAYADHLQGHRRADGTLVVTCPACGEADEIRRYSGTVGRVAE